MLKSCNFMKAFLSSHEQSSVTRNRAKLMVTDKQFQRNSTSFQDDDNDDARCQTMIICHWNFSKKVQLGFDFLKLFFLVWKGIEYDKAKDEES